MASRISLPVAGAGVLPGSGLGNKNLLRSSLPIPVGKVLTCLILLDASDLKITHLKVAVIT